MYPKARLDALSDGIFGVAMTLLALDVRVPEEFHPHDAYDLLRGLLVLSSKFVPYALSFLVLGLRWLSNIHVRSLRETFSQSYANWWLFYHLLVTCVPFTTIVVGRFPNEAPAIWLYAGNTILMSAVAFRMMALTPAIERRDHLRDRQIALLALISVSALAIAVSFIDPRHALWSFALVLLPPLARRRSRAPEATPDGG